MSPSKNFLRVIAPLRLFVITALLVSLSIACAGEPKSDTPLDANLPMDQVIGRFKADRNSIENFYEGLRPSPFLEDRLDALYGEWLEKLAVYNFDSLDQQGRIDFLMLRDLIQHDRAALVHERARFCDGRSAAAVSRGDSGTLKWRAATSSLWILNPRREN